MDQTRTAALRDLGRRFGEELARILGDQAAVPIAPAAPPPAPAAAPLKKRHVCPHCGEEKRSKTSLWHHKARFCAKNPNPACPFCGWRYKPSLINRHMRACDWRDTPPGSIARAVRRE